MAKTPDYFAGKTIVITGAASGIGRATALIFAREKANVVCADIDEDGLAKTAEEVNALGSQALALTTAPHLLASTATLGLARPPAPTSMPCNCRADCTPLDTRPPCRCRP